MANYNESVYNVASFSSDAILPVVTITNIDKTAIELDVKRAVGSPFFNKGGMMKIMPRRSIEIEEARIDISHITELYSKGRVKYNRSRLQI